MNEHEYCECELVVRWQWKIMITADNLNYSTRWFYALKSFDHMSVYCHVPFPPDINKNIMLIILISCTELVKDHRSDYLTQKKTYYCLLVCNRRERDNLKNYFALEIIGNFQRHDVLWFVVWSCLPLLIDKGNDPIYNDNT